MLDEVALLLHTYPEAPLALRVTLAPGQMEFAEALMLIAGTEPTLTIQVAVFVQPSKLVPVTEYSVETPGLTTMLDAVDPVLHR